MKLQALVAAAIASAAVSASAAPARGVWQNLDADHHHSGPAVTAADLKGKVVLIEYWGANCGNCVRSLPHIAELSRKYENYPFVVIGSHVQGKNQHDKVVELLKKAGADYPVYEQAGYSSVNRIGGIPDFAVVSASGDVIADHLAEDTVERFLRRAFYAVEGEEFLAGNGLRHADKAVRAKAAKLVYGKPVASKVAALKAAAARGDAGAKELADAVEKSRERIRDRIAANGEAAPSEALADMKRYAATWTDDNRYASDIERLSASASVRRMGAAASRWKKLAVKPFRDPQTAKSMSPELASLRKSLEPLIKDPLVGREAESLAKEIDPFTMQVRYVLKEAGLLREDKNQHKRGK